MYKKSLLVLLSIFHICIFSIGAISIYNNTTEDAKNVTDAPVFSDTTVLLADSENSSEETEISLVPENTIPAETVPELETVSDDTLVSDTVAAETETETVPQITNQPPDIQCTFLYWGEARNLNIRSGPSLNEKVIGKLPRNATGTVLAFENDNWVLIEYHGIIGYCSTEFLSIQTDSE